jgi:hypothetical protein
MALDVQTKAKFVAGPSRVVQIFRRQQQARTVDDAQDTYDARRLINSKDDAVGFEDELS